MQPQTAKYLKYGLIGLATVGLVYAVTKVAVNPGNGSTEDPTGNGLVTNPGFSVPFNARKVAADLWEQVKPTGFASWISGNGDERENIFNILKRVSDSQFKQVVTAFGKKPYNATFGGTYFAFWEDVTYYGLAFILKKELEAEDYNILKQKFYSSL